MDDEPELLGTDAVCTPEILGIMVTVGTIDTVGETDELGALEGLGSIEEDNIPDTLGSIEAVAITDTLDCPDELSVGVLLLELEAQADDETLDTGEGHGSPDIVGVRLGVLESDK